MIASLDLPASSQVLEASPDKPCLGLVFRLDLRVMAELIAQSSLPPRRNRSAAGSAALGAITPALLVPFCRLLALLDEPGAITVLAPLIEREIHYRLLMSDQAARLWQIASVGSQGNRIARAIDWLKVNFVQPLRIDELAAQTRHRRLAAPGRRGGHPSRHGLGLNDNVAAYEPFSQKASSGKSANRPSSACTDARSQAVRGSRWSA